jgi:ankyrin repeat protein
MGDEPLKINDDEDALVTAVLRSEYELMCSLVKDGANINVTDEYGTTAIMVASESGYDEIIKYLLDHGANINLKDNDGDTALDIAKYHDYKSTVELLKSRGAVGTDGPSAKERMMDAYYDACSIKLAGRFKDKKKPKKRQ